MINFTGIPVHEGIYIFTDQAEYINEILRQDKNGLLMQEDNLTIFPGGKKYVLDEDVRKRLSAITPGSVLEFDHSGRAFVYFDPSSADNTLFMTERCNSNCIMCPMPIEVRRNGRDTDIGKLILLTSYIPEGVGYITITGGEPFIIGKGIFQVLQLLKERKHTQYLLLTNGRAFADIGYCDCLKQSIDSRFTLGIPVHGHCESLHDRITQSKGSFVQTISGMKHLLKRNINIEVRFVIHRQNAEYLTDMAELVIRKLPSVKSVVFIGLEMTGNAGVNAKDVWIDYASAFKASRTAIDRLILHGIDVALYDFPLCCVDTQYWNLCRKSISKNKIRYLPQCDHCSEKDSCGGLFAGTLRFIDRTAVSPMR